MTRESASSTGLGWSPPAGGHRGARLCPAGPRRLSGSRAPQAPGQQLRQVPVTGSRLFRAKITVRISGLLAGNNGLTSRTSGLGSRLLGDSDCGRGRPPGERRAHPRPGALLPGHRLFGCSVPITGSLLSVIKILLSTATWADLEGPVLGEISQKQKDKYVRLHFYVES